MTPRRLPRKVAPPAPVLTELPIASLYYRRLATACVGARQRATPHSAHLGPAAAPTGPTTLGPALSPSPACAMTPSLPRGFRHLLRRGDPGMLARRIKSYVPWPLRGSFRERLSRRSRPCHVSLGRLLRTGAIERACLLLLQTRCASASMACNRKPSGERMACGTAPAPAPSPPCYAHGQAVQRARCASLLALWDGKSLTSQAAPL